MRHGGRGERRKRGRKAGRMAGHGGERQKGVEVRDAATLELLADRRRALLTYIVAGSPEVIP